MSGDGGYDGMADYPYLQEKQQRQHQHQQPRTPEYFEGQRRQQQQPPRGRDEDFISPDQLFTGGQEFEQYHDYEAAGNSSTNNMHDTSSTATASPVQYVMCLYAQFIRNSSPTHNGSLHSQWPATFACKHNVHEWSFVEIT